jgi:transcriptional regulator with XRE-family HTH domain
MTGRQLRAARALLNWSAQELAEASKVSLATIRRAESTDGMPSITTPNAITLRRALEAAGVQFISENGGGAGVRMQSPEPKG